MKTMEELRIRAIAKSIVLLNRNGSSYLFDMAEIIDYMIEKFSQENQPETAEPKPRWRDRTDSDTYTVRKLDDSWMIFFDPNNSEESRRTDNKQMAGVFFTEQKANTCLDTCLGSSPNWERCEEEEEPKPRWQEKTYGHTYTVRKVSGVWVVWFASHKDGDEHYVRSEQMPGDYLSEQGATDVLDAHCKRRSNWERCDEEEESFDEVLAEIMKLRDKLRLGVIFGLGDGLWGIKENNGAGIDIGAAHTLPELRDILRERDKPEPVTREQFEESVDYLHDETSNDHVAHHHYDRAKRFIGEVQASDQNT